MNNVNKPSELNYRKSIGKNSSNYQLKNIAFKKLAQQIYFQPTNHFLNIEVNSVKLIDNQTFKIEFFNESIIPLAEMISFYDALNNNFKYQVKTSFLTHYYSLIECEPELKNYLRWIISDLLKKPKLGEIVFDSKLKINDQHVNLLCDDPDIFNDLKSLHKQITLLLNNYGFNNLTFDLKLEVFQKDLLSKDRNSHLLEVKNWADSYQKKPNSPEKAIKNFSTKGYHQSSISDLKDSPSTNVAIEGQIFGIEEKVTSKQDLVIFELNVTDFKDAITVKYFSKSQVERNNFKNNFKIDDYILIEGAYQLDAYKKQMTVLARKIIKTKNPFNQRVDESKNKRIELSIRTQMSTMDGILNPVQIIDYLQKWNHSAGAIVDLNSVQSFPEFYQYAKKKGFKPIYGATFSVIDENHQAIKNPRENVLLENQTYVVFDLETTGLSPIFDNIIEVGAVKLKNNEIIDRIQFFVKPEKPISEEITKLTNITNEHVKDARCEKSALKTLVEFIQDATLVAHNASFDMGFIYEKLARYNLPPIPNTVIDTLIVARIIHPKAKKYRLESYASRLGIDYDQLVAHRADYDANVLALIWQRSLSFLRELNIKSEQDLFLYRTNELYQKSFAHEITLLVKNQRGLKALFKLISQSLTTNYFNSPKLFFHQVLNQPDLLIGSGALNSRLFNKMIRSNKEEIINEIKHYDYIELQPEQNYLHLLNADFTRDNLREILTFVVQEAQKQNKIVVATGDVRYLELKDRIYHEIYVYAKGLGGERHYLYNYKRKEQILPYQHILTTNEMKSQFQFLNDATLIEQIVVKNTHLIAEQIEHIEVIKQQLFTPTFIDADQKLQEIVFQNAKQIYGNPLPEIVKQRLDKELMPLKQYGFSVIYWISHLLVSKSLNDGYLVGSRGSVGSSLVATMAKITEVNPLPPHYVCLQCKYNEFKTDQSIVSGFDLLTKLCPKCQIELHRDGQNIPFETFLGFEANKVPDIDLNFSGEYQPIIHEEVKKLFGPSHSFRAGTISTVAERTAFGFIKHWEEEKGLEVSDAFRRYLVKGVAGTKRTTGQHPGGIIVIPQSFEVEDFTPINYPANDLESSWQTTHFDFHAIHDNVLKLDLLGHDDPTAIKYLETLTNVPARTIPMHDPKVISLFSSPHELGIKPEDINGETTGAMGIPEFGTKFVRNMLKSVKVKSFGDLISISGLSHGTDVWTNNAEALIKHQGLTLDQLISCRDDIMNDLRLKGINDLEAFKIMEQVRKGQGLTLEQEKILKDHRVEQWYIDALKKIKYMFPKAHATAYVMMAWRIAWYKLYHPLAYYATYFSTRADVSEIETLVGGKKLVNQRLKELLQNRYKRGEKALSNKEQALIPILEMANEAYARGIKISNVDINKSDAKNWIIDVENNTIMAPFNTLDGLGQSVANSIIQARQDKIFTSREDLQNRTSINKTVFQKMIDFGILDHLFSSDQISLDFI